MVIFLKMLTYDHFAQRWIVYQGVLYYNSRMITYVCVLLRHLKCCIHMFTIQKSVIYIYWLIRFHSNSLNYISIIIFKINYKVLELLDSRLHTKFLRVWMKPFLFLISYTIYVCFFLLICLSSYKQLFFVPYKLFLPYNFFF